MLGALFGPRAIGSDWPQWRGPERNGISRETGWLKGWPESGSPKVAWRAAVGKGHSAVSVANGRAFTMGWDGSHDTVFFFDAASGKPIWKQSYPCQTILQWPGPRATPTVHDGVVYTLGQHGQLRAWNAQTGKRVGNATYRRTTTPKWTMASLGRAADRMRRADLERGQPRFGNSHARRSNRMG
jgi:outer membrane protein assembly factor BamB